MKIATTIAASAATLVLATGAYAATTATFDDFYYASGNGSWQSSLSFTEGDLKLDVTATTATNGHALTGDAAKVQHWQNAGLGVWSNNDTNHQVDSSGPNDVALFSFSLNGVAQQVKITQIKFSYVDSNDMFDLYLDGVFGGDYDLGYGPYASVGMDTSYASVFGIGAAQYEKRVCFLFCWNQTYTSDFKIKSMTVQYDVPTDVPPTSEVPLPAGGLLLVSALGGAGLLRRRKR